MSGISRFWGRDSISYCSITVPVRQQSRGTSRDSGQQSSKTWPIHEAPQQQRLKPKDIEQNDCCSLEFVETVDGQIQHSCALD